MVRPFETLKQNSSVFVTRRTLTMMMMVIIINIIIIMMTSITTNSHIYCCIVIIMITDISIIMMTSLEANNHEFCYISRVSESGEDGENSGDGRSVHYWSNYQCYWSSYWSSSPMCLLIAQVQLSLIEPIIMLTSTHQ